MKPTVVTKRRSRHRSGKAAIPTLRVLAVAVLASVASVGSALPVRAATPAFEVDVKLSGADVIVTVTFMQAVSPELEASGVLDRLVGLYRADDVDESGRPRESATLTQLSLAKIDSRVFRAESVVDPDIEWAVVPWPLVTDLNTTSAATATLFLHQRRSNVAVAIAVSAGVVLLLGFRIWLVRRQRR